MQGHRQPRPNGHQPTGRASEYESSSPDNFDFNSMQHPAFRQNLHQPAYESWYDENDYIDAYAEDPQSWPLSAHTSTDRHEAWSPDDDRDVSHRQQNLHQNNQYEPRLRPRPQQQTPPTQAHHGSGQWTGDGYNVPQPFYDQEFLQAPPPAAQMLPPFGRNNQRMPLGPPPSARRGPASYYAHAAPVHPIFEEAESARGSVRDGAHSSYASSNAIPIGVPEYYLTHGETQDRQAPTRPATEADDQSPYAHADQTRDYRFEGDPSRYDPSPEPAPIVRQASLGKRSKPTLTTVQSSEKMRNNSSSNESGRPSLPSQKRRPSPAKPSERVYAQDVHLPAGNDGGAEHGRDARDMYYNYQSHEGHAVADSPRSYKSQDTWSHASDEKALEDALSASRQQPKHLRPYNSTESFNRTPSSEVFADAPVFDQSPTSDFEGEKLSQAVRPTSVSNKLSPHHGQQSRTRARSPLAKHMRESDIRKSLEAGGALEMTETRSGHLKAPTPGMSERVGRQRPPTLDMSKLKDAEARGSLTSLPDLIKRNMRLASNLDRGRTVSRLGLEWFTSDGNKSNARKSAGSLSDILSSFPAPGAQTPTGGRLNPHGSFASFNKGNLRHSTLPSDSDAPDGRTPQRRCCGMPLWLFLIMLLVLFLLVAAAVVVPVMLLVVVPDMDNSSSAPGSDCQTQLQCHNGGTGIVGQDGNCRCLCVNGYTGDSCNQSSAARCTTTTVGSVDDATVGDAIPRLLQLANSDFGIPLDGSTLLGLFSSNDLSCNTENSLVTFNGASVGKRSTQDSSRRSSTLARRQTSTESPNSQATSNGIVYQTGSPTSSSDTSASTSSSSPSSQSSSANDSSDTRDFARTVVLYIFQVSGELSSASSAQSNLQYYFSNGQSADGQQLDPTNVQLDNGYHCNLDAFSLTLANGTTVGEQSAGKKWVLG